MRQLVEDYHAQGVMYEQLKFCEFWGYERALASYVMTHDYGIPSVAIDRQNAKLEPFSDTHHPAVLKAIRMAADAGHRHNIRVGICGELGADLSLTETFLRMDVDELSVDPKSILPLRRQIRSIDLTKDPLEGTIVY